MRNRKTLFALLAGLFLTPALAIAADEPAAGPDAAQKDGMPHHRGMPPRGDMRGGMMPPEIINLAFSALDTNKDGKISKEEFEAQRPERIQMADANKDGKVTKKEFEKFVVERAKAHADEMFARLDRNKDGTIDSADSKMMADTRFDRLDTNHDGSITKDEFVPRGMMARGDRGDRDHRFHGPRPDKDTTTQ